MPVGITRKFVINNTNEHIIQQSNKWYLKIKGCPFPRNTWSLNWCFLYCFVIHFVHKHLNLIHIIVVSQRIYKNRSNGNMYIPVETKTTISHYTLQFHESILQFDSGPIFYTLSILDLSTNDNASIWEHAIITYILPSFSYYKVFKFKQICLSTAYIVKKCNAIKSTYTSHDANISD